MRGADNLALYVTHQLEQLLFGNAEGFTFIRKVFIQPFLHVT